MSYKFDDASPWFRGKSRFNYRSNSRPYFNKILKELLKASPTNPEIIYNSYCRTNRAISKES